MRDKYDVYDASGRKIGSAERVPSAADEAAGLVLFLAVFGKPLLILAAILTAIAIPIAIVMGIYGAGSNLVNYGTLDSNAIATAQAQQWRTALIARLSQPGALQLPKEKKGGFSTPNDFYRVDQVEFQPGRFLVYFESNIGVGNWEDDCIMWYERGIYQKQPSIEKQMTTLSSHHVKGYMVFPDSIIIPGTHFLFSHSCGDTYWESIELWSRDF
ncbi:MAG: hypothetical protein WCF84_18790 [Anaerolineae bacterium]